MAFNETNHTGEFLLSEGNGYFSRETVTIASEAGAMVSGTVLGKVTATGEYRAYDNADSPAGVGTAAAILYTAVEDQTVDQKAVVIARHAEVAEDRLTGFDANARADLLALGIIVR